MVELKIPFPPSLNGFQRNITVNRRIDSPAYREWKLKASREAVRQYPEVTPYSPLFQAPVMVSYIFLPPDKRRRDLDNYAKPANDFLVAYGFLKDDSLIHKLTLEWGIENKVTIRSLNV